MTPTMSSITHYNTRYWMVLPGMPCLKRRWGYWYTGRCSSLPTILSPMGCRIECWHELPRVSAVRAHAMCTTAWLLDLIRFILKPTTAAFIHLSHSALPPLFKFNASVTNIHCAVHSPRPFPRTPRPPRAPLRCVEAGGRVSPRQWAASCKQHGATAAATALLPGCRTRWRRRCVCTCRRSCECTTKHK